MLSGGCALCLEVFCEMLEENIWIWFGFLGGCLFFQGVWFVFVDSQGLFIKGYFLHSI